MALPAFFCRLFAASVAFENMATAMTGFLGWLKNQRSDTPENWQYFRLHQQCS
jgi:hypothetical protein